MSHGFHHSPALQLVGRAANAFRLNAWILNQADPEGLRYAATVSVWVHWCAGVIFLIELAYLPYQGFGRHAAYALPFGLLMACNGCLHYRLLSNRKVTWRWLLAVWGMGVAVASACVAMSAGFSQNFFYVFYYPSLAGFAVTFTSVRLNLAWVTLVCAVYAGISVSAGDGLDLEARDEKLLLFRITFMYAIVATVNLISRFERMRWRRAVEREGALQRERVEFSQAVHDTTAQSAYLMGLGIDTARAQAGEGNPELTATLEELSRLSRSTIWDLRHPISMGGIYEGRELGRALRSHAGSFTNVTSVPAEMTQEGVEPPLSVETRGLLFSIAHNALTNAYRHAGATRVSVHLEFGGDGIRLTVSDDGVGLPDDYADRGHGFANMSREARRLGGRLVVEKRGSLGGATVTCVMPPERG